KALHSSNRTTRLAGIAAAPTVADKAELLPALADVAAGADRRTAIPAVRAALAIATDLGANELPDDLAPDDIEQWRARFDTVARAHHPVEVRVLALETCRTLAHVVDPAAAGFDVKAFSADADPDVARAAADLAR